MLGPESSKVTGVGGSLSQIHMKTSNLYIVVCQVCRHSDKHLVLDLGLSIRVYGLAILLSILQTPCL